MPSVEQVELTITVALLRARTLTVVKQFRSIRALELAATNKPDLRRQLDRLTAKLLHPLGRPREMLTSGVTELLHLQTGISQTSAQAVKIASVEAERLTDAELQVTEALLQRRPATEITLTLSQPLQEVTVQPV